MVVLVLTAVLIDEMYLQKGVQYHGGSLISDDDGNFYFGIVVFMMVRLKKSITIVIKACTKFQISCSLISSHIEETLETLYKASFNVRAIITDNHATNFSAFKILHCKFGEQNNDLLMKLEKFSNFIQENELCHDSYKIAINVAGYITKKIVNKSDCANCLTSFSFNQV